MAYRRARRDLRSLEEIAALHGSHEDPDLVQDLNAAMAGDEEGLAARKARHAAQKDELDRVLKSAGMSSGGPLYKDLRLPLEYWAKRSALRDAVASFRGGGIIAIAGLAVSTVASVWSLYLPAG